MMKTSFYFRFLHFYSRYLSGEKKQLDDMTDSLTPEEDRQIGHLKELRHDLEKLYLEKVYILVSALFFFLLKVYFFSFRSWTVIAFTYTELFSKNYY